MSQNPLSDYLTDSQASEAISASEALIHGLPEALLVIDAAGNILFANRSAERLFGLPVEQLRTQSFTHSVSLKTSSEIAILRDANEIIYAEALYAEIHWNRMPAYIVSLRDITERKYIESSIIKSQAHYHAISGLTSDYAYTLKIESDGQVSVEWGIKSLLSITGYRREELSQLGGWQALIHPEDAKALEIHRTQLFKGVQDIAEGRILTKMGERWFRDYAQPVYDKTLGRIVRIYGALKDITEQKTTEKELERYRLHLEEMVEARTNELEVTNEKLRQEIVVRKRSEEELQGYRLHLEEMVRERTAELADTNAKLVLEIQERMEAQSALAEERGLLAQRVKERTAELSAANAALANAARTKDEFLASMSHELRTPLNAILGIAEFLDEEVYGPLTQKQRQSLKSITESGQHLLSLINDILDLSKIEAGKLNLEVGPMSVDSICQTSLRLVRAQAQKKRLTLEYKLEPNVDVMVADGRRLKQMLVNLLGNAVKFTPESGRIGLNVVGDEEEQAVHFTVWDSGIGIAPDDLSRLFKPFTQLDSGLNREYGGTGLGLALVYRMAEMHEGSVGVTSELGRGSQFTIILPWKKPELAKEQVQEDQETAGSAGERGTNGSNEAPQSGPPPVILLAEDNETILAHVPEYLRVKGYEVIIARNGNEAIERAMEMDPDLILMDVQMPEMDGFEAIRRLRKNERFAQTPMVALTALAMPGDRQRCLDAGAIDYLSKPVSLKLLVKTIERLRRRKVASQSLANQPQLSQETLRS